MIISVDIETDGPVPHLYSMVSLGAVSVDTDEAFYYTFKPISVRYNEDALKVSGFTREQTLTFPDAKVGMEDFHWWLNELSGGKRLTFMSDNAGFDWQFVNYYFVYADLTNPFGFSPMSLTWFAKGLEKNTKYNDWKKKYRTTKHTHNALDDARGNAEAFRKMREVYGFK